MTLFSLENRHAVIVGGAGVLGTAIARGLAAAGARVSVADLRNAEATAETLVSEGYDVAGYTTDATDHTALETCADRIVRKRGPVHVLVSAAGGNRPDATTAPDRAFFDLPLPAMERVVALNLFGGAVIPTQVFARTMAHNPEGGSIITISSMNAFRPLTRIPGYSAAKAAVSNFTQWLAVHLAQEYNPKLRVNAIAPGFFCTEQNRYLLFESDGTTLTERGRRIIAHTPMGRFGIPEELVGPCVWLASDASSFVTGVVLPVDGGFNAYAGV